MIPLVILVFIDAQDAATALPGALAHAVEEALGPEIAVSTRVFAGDAPLATLADAGRAEHATVVARVAWTDDRRAEARLEVAATDGGFSRSSTITFDGADPLAERGRAIGLVLAALVAPEKQARIEREKIARATAAPVVASTPAPASPPPRRFALDATAESGIAIGDAGSGVGGGLGLRWLPGNRLGWRVGVKARFGEVGSAQATALDVAAGAGLALFVRVPAEDRSLAVALRADALLLYQSLSHLSADDPAPVRGARVLPGALALVETQWALSPTLALLVAGGAEVVFGTTDVFVHQIKVAEIAPLRAVAEAGLVARF